MSTEEAETEILSTQLLSSLSKSEDASGSISDDNINNDDDFTDIVVDYDDLHEDALEYVAGYIARRLKLGEDYVYPSGMSSQSTYTWIDELSEGGLKKPTEEFLTKLKKLELIFNVINKDNINTNSNYLSNLLSKVKHNDLDDKIKTLFFRCRMYFRIRELNKKFIFSNLNKKHKKTFT